MSDMSDMNVILMWFIASIEEVQVNDASVLMGSIGIDSIHEVSQKIRLDLELLRVQAKYI